MNYEQTKNNRTYVNRISFLDGMRGWASFAVLLHHIFMCFLVLTTPLFKYDRERLMQSISNFNYFDILGGILIKFITDGQLAVMIFFIISGYALSVGYLDLSKRKLALAAISRYFRLAIPIFVTSLIAYILLKNNLMYNLEVAITPEKSSAWLGTFYKFDAQITDLIKFSFYDVFFKYDPDNTYNSSLWTMPFEIFGSLMIYAYLGIFRTTEKVYWKLIVSSISILFIFNPVYSCFLIGYLIAEINKKYSEIYINLDMEKHKNKIEIFFILFFLLNIILSTYFRNNSYETCLFAFFMIVSVSFSKYLKLFFSNKFSNFLGKISFPLYLIQVPIICSFSSFLYLKLPELGFTIVTSNIINLFLTIFLCLVAATFLLPLEKFSIIYSKKMAKFFIR